MSKPRVLLLGDSIRMSYQPMVAQMLADEANVVGPAENGQFSLYTLAHLPAWLDELGCPDIVHWNNGIHDSGHNPDRQPRQIPLDIYVMTLGYILQQLTATGAKIIFATSTPVHPDMPFRNDTWAWRNPDIDAYNAAARNVMKVGRVPVNNLHAVVAADPDALLAEDQLHLSDAGQHACAKAVAAAVRTRICGGES